jgi:hypothetical protein
VHCLGVEPLLIRTLRSPPSPFGALFSRLATSSQVLAVSGEIEVYGGGEQRAPPGMGTGIPCREKVVTGTNGNDLHIQASTRPLYHTTLARAATPLTCQQLAIYAACAECALPLIEFSHPHCRE